MASIHEPCSQRCRYDTLIDIDQVDQGVVYDSALIGRLQSLLHGI